MASDTKNVKLGVCKVLYNGVDLGYTQGGVEVTVATQTHKVNVDQFGKSTINEYILSRDVMVKLPLVETTLDNLVAIMPGATLITDGVAATGSITIATQPAAGQTVVINGKTLTFKTALSSPAVAGEVQIGASVAATATNLANTLKAYADAALAVANYYSAALSPVVSVTYGLRGSAGNTFTIVTGTAAASVAFSGATLTGGVDSTQARVDVTNGIGVDLLSISKELRLHPKSKAVGDLSEDFVIPLAATPGGLKFKYVVDAERVYDCEFMGFPDPITSKLFYIGF